MDHSVSDLQAPLILTLDIGSSSVRAIVFDARACSLANLTAQVKYQFRTTPDGGVEIDADPLLEHCVHVIDEMVGGLGDRAKRIAAVASDCFVMSILGVDAQGNAVTPVYTYADSRGARKVEELRRELDERKSHQRVGTLFHTSYLPARIKWIAEERSAEFQRARYWMSFGEYLYFKLLGVRTVSHSAASWTGLLNRATLDWDNELIASLPLERDQLSPISAYEFRAAKLRQEYSQRWGGLRNAAWFLTIGDGAAANVGSGCVDASRVSLTIGTSSALRITMPTAEAYAIGAKGEGRPIQRPSRKIPAGLWAYRVDAENELMGGALSEGGNVYAWMKDVMHLGEGEEVERELAAMQPDAHGLTVMPFFAGERAPNWYASARASIIGMTLSTRPIEILRAGMEGVAYRLGLVYDLMRDAAPKTSAEIPVIASGGALMRSPTWVQLIADVLNTRVIASAESEATSRGVALMALKAIHVIQSLNELPAQTGRIYEPDASRHGVYARASERQKKWYNSLMGEVNEKR
jgi:gluconokinase